MAAATPAPHAPPASDPAAPNDAPRPRDVSFDVRAYPPVARASATLLQAVGALNLAYLAANVALDALGRGPPAPAAVVALGLLTFTGAPWLAAAAIGRWSRATLAVGADYLTLARRAARSEIPISSVKAVRPFALPLPGPGITLVLASGRAFRHRLVLDHPGPLVAAVAEHVAQGRAALASPALAYADAKHARRARRRRPYRAVKWVFVPLALSLIVFRLDQYIMYGGLWGQYRLYGFVPYAKSLLEHAAGAWGALALYAAAVRAVVEPAALAATWLAPARARAVRAAAETLGDVAYFVLAPALVAARLLF
jgi:hypothetical protein